MSKYTWSWANAADDLYFSITNYKLARIWGTNFIGICKSTYAIWTEGTFNTSYDNNQSGLTIDSYYWYNLTTWAIELWGDFKAISETEIILKEIEKVELVAWEAIAAKSFYRRGVVAEAEDIYKYFTAKADDTDKLGVIGMIEHAVALGDKFPRVENKVVTIGTASSYEYVSGTAFDIDQLTQNATLTEEGFWQSFTIWSEKISLTTISIEWTANYSPICRMDLYDSDDVLLWSVSTTVSNAVIAFNFTSQDLTLEALGVYYFDVQYVSWSTNQQYAYQTTDVYAWGTRRQWGSATTWDMYFNVSWFEYATPAVWDDLYLQDDWTIWAVVWTNTVVLWQLYSDNELELVNNFNWESTTSATAWALTLWLAVWYVTIKINWKNQKIPYYDI